MPSPSVMSDACVPRRAARRAAAVLVALLALSALPPTLAAADTYTLDPVHTRVLLAIDHAGFSQALGTVSGSTGTLVFDRDDWTTARLQAEVPLARVDFGDEAWNAATRGRGLLDAGRHPVARFRSTRIEPLGDDRARVVGLLSLRGVEREVILDVVLNGLRRYPLPPFRRTVGFSATTTISRAAFGSTAWGSVIGDSVALRFEVEATRGGSAEALEGDDGADASATSPKAETTWSTSDADAQATAADSASVDAADAAAAAAANHGTAEGDDGNRDAEASSTATPPPARQP